MHNIKKILALVLVAVSVFSFSSCLKYTSNILEFTTRPDQPVNTPGEVQTTTIYITENTTQAPPVNIEVQTTLPQEITTAAPEQTTAAPVIVPEVTTAPAEKDPSSWTTAEILKFATDAVTKTKAYTNNVTVDHQEAFDVRVTKAPGGQLVMSTADRIIASVAKPSQEVLTFTNGRTTNAEGENVPLLLPKRGAFTLTEDGIATAYAKKSGNDTIVHIQLVKEVGTLTNHPKFHAASVGYLDASDVDLGSTVVLNYLDITYSGSTMDFVINSDGYVSSVVYKIPIHIAVEAKIVGIPAAGECEGSQSETWKINW
ncbi:MAG: hypothetical protein IKL10_11600 [Clostridia bacterium]|nr:hypothetical protein [Clostridia bacterium]